jgi:hypothetical protein
VKTIALLLGVVLLAIFPSSLPAQTRSFKHKVYDSSLELFVMEKNPEDNTVMPEPECAAQSFQKIPRGYLLLTAAHCVVEERSAGFIKFDEIVVDNRLFVDYGNPDASRKFIPVTIKLVGDLRNGYDIAILEMDTTAVLPVIPLGDESTLDMGDKLVSVSGPEGAYVKFWFEGYLSAKKSQIDPALVRDRLGWKNLEFIEMGGTFGSSGSAIISVDQRAIVGVYDAMFRPSLDRISIGMVPVSIVKQLIAHPDQHTLSLNRGSVLFHVNH